MTHKQKTVLQALAATFSTLLFAIGLKASGLIQDEIRFLTCFALYLAWLARIRNP